MTATVITNAGFTQAAIGLADRAVTKLLIIQYLFIVDTTPSHPTPRIARALMAAAERGVQVDILLNHFSHGRAARDAARRRPPALQHQNIDLRWHTSGSVLHCKIIVGDELEMLIGSHNLSHWSLTRSQNLSMLTVDTTTARDILAIYRPLFDKGKRA